MAYRTDRTERAKLYKLWVTKLDRPCALCGSRDKRNIAHMIPYYKGGETDKLNCRVLCRQCNLDEHPVSKFNLGSRVMLNGRAPAYIDLARHRPRTIIKIEYNNQRQCNYYLVGSNGQGANPDGGNPQDGYSAYWFRSYMLLPYTPRRYHFKRQYHHLATISSGQQGGGQTGQSAPGYPDQSEHSLDLQGRHELDRPVDLVV